MAGGDLEKTGGTLTVKQIIRRAFAAHIHGGGIISAPDKLVGENCRQASPGQVQSTDASDTLPSTRMTLAEHAEAWWGEQGQMIPPRKSAEWNAMYTRWIEFAFAGR